MKSKLPHRNSDGRSRAPGRMPNFLIIGAEKSGTSSLFDYLGQHPDVYTSPLKEPSFFAYEGIPAHTLPFRMPVRTDLESYQALFAGVTTERAIGEASVHYLTSPVAAERIRRRLPDVRLIAILRDPVERAYSSFMQRQRAGLETRRSFRAAVEADRGRSHTARDAQPRYLAGGRYHRLLLPYLAAFGREQLRIYLYEDLRDRPLQTLADAYGFLGVDARFRPDISVRHNVASRPVSLRMQRVLARPPASLSAIVRATSSFAVRASLSRRLQRMNSVVPPGLDPGLRTWLLPEFLDDIGQLEELLGRDLSAWREVVPPA